MVELQNKKLKWRARCITLFPAEESLLWVAKSLLIEQNEKGVVMEWYYEKQGQQSGPVDFAELCRLARQGEIAPDNLVWNPTHGDQWVPASSIEGLFDSTSLVAPPPLPTGAPATELSHGNTSNRDLMRMARESLRNNWSLAIGVAVLYLVIILAAQFIPRVNFLIRLLIDGPMNVGFCLIFLSLARRRNASVGQLFNGFNRFGTALGAYLLATLFVILWSLLFIIPGIIAAYSYAMTFFIIADDPSVKALDAIRRSKEMMRGRKWKLFCLYWRFIGWLLLCGLTLGIGLLWLIPYMQTSAAHFYDDSRQQHQ